MTLTPTNLINDAYMLALPHADDRRIGPGVLLAELTQLEKEIADIFANSNPERLSVAGTNITVVAATNPGGYDLLTGSVYTDFKWIDNEDNVYPIYLVNERQLDDAPIHPAGIVRGSKFYPADPLGRRWVDTDNRGVFTGNGDVISYRYIPEPGRVTGLTQALFSPDEARQYLLWSLTLTILMSSDATDLVIQRVAEARARARADLVFSASKRAGV